MAQLVALMSGVVLGGVAEVVGSILARGKISSQLIHYIPLYPLAKCGYHDKTPHDLGLHCLPMSH